MTAASPDPTWVSPVSAPLAAFRSHPSSPRTDPRGRTPTDLPATAAPADPPASYPSYFRPAWLVRSAARQHPRGGGKRSRSLARREKLRGRSGAFVAAVAAVAGGGDTGDAAFESIAGEGMAAKMPQTGSSGDCTASAASEDASPAAPASLVAEAKPHHGRHEENTVDADDGREVVVIVVVVAGRRLAVGASTRVVEMPGKDGIDRSSWRFVNCLAALGSASYRGFGIQGTEGFATKGRMGKSRFFRPFVLYFTLVCD